MNQFDNIDKHLNEEAMMATQNDVYNHIVENDHLKICTWCNEQLYDLLEKINQKPNTTSTTSNK